MLWATAAPHNGHITKQVLTGAIKDVAWSPDETCIALCGSGVGLRACVISAKTGDTISDLPGHTRTVLSLDFSPTLPYRIITSSEGFSVNLYAGDPL
jgi:WD40 repeat protein